MFAADLNPARRHRGDCAPALAFGVVLLAAGASSRMGRPKLLLPWGTTTVLGHLLAELHRLEPTQVVVMLSGADRTLEAELDRLTAVGQIGLGGLGVERVLNPAPARGMFSSIQVAAAWAGWNPIITHWLISLGDQPHVRLDTWRRLLAEAVKHPDRICQPARAGRPRHPVLLPARPFRELPTSTDGHLKQFLAARAADRHSVEIDDPGLDLDLDTPTDYDKARQLMGMT